MDLYKIIKIIAFALAIIGAAFALMIIAGDEESAQSMGGYMLYITYLVLALVIALVLVYVVKGLIDGDVKKTLIPVGIFLGIILLSYLFSSGTDLDLEPFTKKGADVTESTSKKVGAGLYAFYILAFLAVGSMVFSGVQKILNNNK